MTFEGSRRATTNVATLNAQPYVGQVGDGFRDRELGCLSLRVVCSEISKTYLRTVCRTVGKVVCGQPLATVVRVIQSTTLHTVARAWKGNVQTCTTLVTRPKRPTLKSRRNALSGFYVWTAKNHVLDK